MTIHDSERPIPLRRPRRHALRLVRNAEPNEPEPAGERGTRQPPLGPVIDLERHVRSGWWHEIFDELYLKTDGDVFENPANTVADIDQLIAGAGLTPKHRVLDLCCGQGRHTIELAQRGFRDVTGVDASHFLIELARKRAADAGIEIMFLEDDARRCRLRDHQYDCIAILGNSFGYFDAAEDDAALLRRACRLLRRGGRLALELVDGDWLRTHFEKRSWEWLDRRLLVCRERALSKDGERLVTREMVLAADGGVIADRFFAERLYSEASIADLLDRAGFHQLRFHDLTPTRSDRDSDLGMMGRRRLVIAEPRAQAQALHHTPPRDVAVVLGDPRRADSVKPGGRFGTQDLDTVARLKAALETLLGYRFRYLDDHAKLPADLTAAAPDLVLNLCDEGYRNDPTMEAHVPALIELLGLPFTGAGPACLTLCYDKAAVRGVAAGLDIAVPGEVFVAPDDGLDRIMALPASAFPVLVKPGLGDNSVGIDERSVAATPEAACATLQRLRRAMPGRPFLVQEFLDGAEYTVGLVGNPGGNPGHDLRRLPILEVDYSKLEAGLPHILAYASKWHPHSAYGGQIGYQRAALPAATEHLLADAAERLFRRLGCRDYARFDFRAASDGTVKLLEVNPNPGWCWDGKLNLMAGLDGLSYAELLGLILAAAERRVAPTRAVPRAALRQRTS